jgi:energy-converting hydrogenase Eha subunit G
MAGKEGSPGFVEKAARLSKGFDVIMIAGGVLMGGPAGLALIASGGITYYIADRVEKRGKRQ